MLYPYVFVAGPNKHEYLRRCIGAAGVPTPVPASMLCDTGTIECMYKRDNGRIEVVFIRVAGGGCRLAFAVKYLCCQSLDWNDWL